MSTHNKYRNDGRCNRASYHMIIPNNSLLLPLYYTCEFRVDYHINKGNSIPAKLTVNLQVKAAETEQYIK